MRGYEQEYISSNSSNNSNNIVIGNKNMVGKDDMGLEKSIKSGKERRKQYRGAKGIDRSCRNHGNCIWCEENRRYRERRLKIDKKYMKDILTKDGD